jgi:hypothetical protein
MERSAQLLGRGFPRFDMRIPGKFIVRVTDQPGTTIPELAPETAPAPAPAAPGPAAPAPAPVARPAPGQVDARTTI